MKRSMGRSGIGGFGVRGPFRLVRTMSCLMFVVTDVWSVGMSTDISSSIVSQVCCLRNHEVLFRFDGETHNSWGSRKRVHHRLILIFWKHTK